MLCLLGSLPDLREQMPPAAQWMTPSEAARLASLGSPARREAFLAGRWLARQAVQRWSGCTSLPQLHVAVGGACTVSDPSDAHVSISHCGLDVTCVAGGSAVGVDVEDLGRQRDFLALAQAVHSPAQCALLATLPDDARAEVFLQWWVLKEAWLKARGRGIDFKLMRSLDFKPDRVGDVAVTRLGSLVLAVAAETRLAPRIDSHGLAGGVVWQRMLTIA